MLPCILGRIIPLSLLEMVRRMRRLGWGEGDAGEEAKGAIEISACDGSKDGPHLTGFATNEAGGGGAGCMGDTVGNAGGHGVALEDDKDSDWPDGRGGHSTIDSNDGNDANCGNTAEE